MIGACFVGFFFMCCMFFFSKEHPIWCLHCFWFDANRPLAFVFSFHGFLINHREFRPSASKKFFVFLNPLLV